MKKNVAKTERLSRRAKFLGIPLYDHRGRSKPESTIRREMRQILGGNTFETYIALRHQVEEYEQAIAQTG